MRAFILGLVKRVEEFHQDPQSHLNLNIAFKSINRRGEGGTSAIDILFIHLIPKKCKGKI